MLPIKTGYVGILLLAAHTVLVHCAIEPPMSIEGIQNDLQQRSDDMLTYHKRPSFFVGSRYGRSGYGGPSQSMYATAKARRLSIMPRSERFFLGSRYGKRADEYMSPYEQDIDADNNAIANAMLSQQVASTAAGAAEQRFDSANGIADDSSINSGSGSGTNSLFMSCIYTGRRNYFRCNAVERINNYNNNILNRLANEHSDDENSSINANANNNNSNNNK